MMKHVILMMIIAAGPARAAELVLKDAEGDVGGMDASQDIVELRLSSGNGRILMQITTAKDFVTVTDLSGDPPEKLVEVNVAQLAGLAIDSDNNQTTGATPTVYHDHVSGFEWEVSVVLCADVKEDGIVKQYCAATSNPVGASLMVELISTNLDDMNTYKLSGGQIDGRTAKVEIPYSKIGVSAGKSVRLYPMEKGLPANADKRFEPVLLKLE